MGRPKLNAKDETFTARFRIPTTVWADFVTVCNIDKLSPSEVIRALIKDWIRKQGGR